MSISIHAPSRERRWVTAATVAEVRFQSTLPRGSDTRCIVITCSYFLFQSTLPRGSDYPGCQSTEGLYYFNPRSLAGATQPYKSCLPDDSNFNPRSLAGATALSHRRCLFLRISIHAPSRERPNRINLAFRTIVISIHAPSRERPPYLIAAVYSCAFQSTLPRGSDPTV